MRHLLVVLAVLAALTVPASAAADPNDPGWPLQWAERLTRTSEVWARTTGDPRVVIAVVDTGLGTVPDLAGNVVPGWDVLDGDPDPFELTGHGTWVTSIIAARGNNRSGIAGYCWNCSVMPVRVGTTSGGAKNTAIAAGIVWAVDHGARIVNLAVATGSADPDMQRAVAYAAAKNVLVVASAGNTGDARLQYPAAFPEVLSVAGTDENDVLYPWATRGAWVELAAPGCEALLDAIMGVAYGCGSSFGPSAVSGIAGLLLSLKPDLTAQQLASTFRTTAHPVEGIGGGRIDAWAALSALGLAAPKPPPPAARPELYDRQAFLVTGSLKARQRLSFRVGRGRLDVQLVTRAARGCSVTLVTRSSAFVGIAGETNVISLSAFVPAGRWNVQIDCTNPRRRAYLLSVTGMFPRTA